LIHIKRIRNAGRRDLGAVTEIDSLITRVRKPKYWAEALRRYGGRGRGRFFLVAETEAGVRGYIVGEVRDWAFGEPPCGWVFEMGVHPRARLAGLGTRLLEALCARLRESGVDKVRTLLARDNALVLAFFRSQGMMAAPLITLEKELA
jgi:ribosomal protein S18 acetylase RimI-like enzyme